LRKTLLAGAAAFVLTAAPSVLFAQDPAPTPPQGSAAPAPEADGTTTVTTTETTTSSTPQAAKGTEAGRTVAMTTKQKTVYATWPAQRRTDYDALTGEYQTYYWTLTPVQQEGYWALTPDQRGQIYKMSPEQRATAWKSIEQQLAGQTPTTPEGQANPPGQGVPTAGVPNPQTANQAAQPAMPADESYQGGPYKGAKTPAPADAMGKDYPVCSKNVTDGCRNRGGK
jgi:hypothetical protein